MHKHSKKRCFSSLLHSFYYIYINIFNTIIHSYNSTLTFDLTGLFTPPLPLSSSLLDIFFFSLNDFTRFSEKKNFVNYGLNLVIHCLTAHPFIQTKRNLIFVCRLSDSYFLQEPSSSTSPPSLTPTVVPPNNPLPGTNSSVNEITSCRT